MLGAATVFQPAHERGVPAGHLHAVDAEIEVVLLGLGRALGDHQRPSDQRRRLARPAALDRQPAEIDVSTAQHNFLTRRPAERPGAHGQRQLEDRCHLHGILEAARRLWLAQESQQFAQLAQLVRLTVHAPGNPLDGTEQIDQHRHLGAFDVLEQDCRAAFRQETRVNLGHFQNRANRRAHAHQPAGALQHGHEIA